MYIFPHLFVVWWILRPLFEQSSDKAYNCSIQVSGSEVVETGRNWW